MADDSSAGGQPHLPRPGLLPAIALNRSNMVGVGPFITIFVLIVTIHGGGPQAMLGWNIRSFLAIPGGLIWAEFGAVMSGSGGS